MTELTPVSTLIKNQETIMSQEIVEEKPFDASSLKEVRKSIDISVATDVPVDMVHLSRTNNDHSYEAEARNVAFTTSSSEVIETSYLEGLTVDKTAILVKDAEIKAADFSSIGDFVLLNGLILDDGSINPYAAKAMTNLTMIDKMTQEFILNSGIDEQSTTSKVLEFIDVNILRGITLGIFEDITFRTNREGEEIRKAVTGMSPVDFKEWFTGYLTDRQDEGFFTRGSAYNIYNAANDARYMGDNPQASLFAALSIFDAVGYGKLAKGVIKSSLRPTSKLSELSKVKRAEDAIAVMKGAQEAGEVAVRVVDDIGVQVDGVSAGRLLPSDLDPAAGPLSRPSQAAVRRGTTKTILMEKLELLNRKFTFGQYVARESIEEAADIISSNIAKRTNDVVVNTRRIFNQGSDDYTVVVTLGKDGTGGAFKRKMDVVAIANTDPSLKVVKADNGKGWFLEFEQRVDILKLPEKSERFVNNNIISDAVSRVFGASTTRVGDRLSALFSQAEAGQAKIGQLTKPIQKTISKLNQTESKGLDNFFRELLDGDLSYLRKAPDMPTFEAEYAKLNNSLPSQKVKDAYLAMLEIGDTTWNIMSSKRLKRLVQEDAVFVQFTDELGGIAIRADGKVPDNELVLNVATGKSLPADKFKDQPIYKVPDIFLDHQYVTGVRSTRVLEKVDVMPYNVGGPRLNENMRWFVGATTQKVLASGKEVNVAFKTILGSFSKQQSAKAVNELNNISDYVKAVLVRKQVTSISELKLSKLEIEEFGNVIRANNSWNKHFTDFKDILRVADETGFGFTERFVFKARDEQITALEAGENAVLGGQTAGEVSRVRSNMKRGDTPLIEYGGEKARTASPMANIAEQFSSEAFGYANRAANQNAIVGWVKLAEANPSLITNFSEISALPKNEYLKRLLNAQVSKMGEAGDVAAQLREQQGIIKRRLNQPTALSERWESFSNSVAESVFSSTGKKLDMSKSDPAAQLLKVGFYSKFGFLNVDQFLLQGIHSITIAAISPVHGGRALGMSIPLLGVMSLSDGATRRLAIKQLAKGAFLPEDELNDLVKYIDDSGRNIVDNTTIELQGTNQFGTSSNLTGKALSAAKNLLDKSTIFFKEGERLTRMTGIATAFLEHRAKRPDVDPFSAEGKAWITNREQALTFRMTTAGKGAYQSGPLKVPTQWLSFSLRAMENVFIGRDFTATERLSMLAVMGPMFGLTGIGLGNTAGYVVEKMGYEADDPKATYMFNNVKYGLMDQLLSWALGTETAYASRVAPVTGLQDVYEKLYSDQFLTVLFGPSGEIATDMLSTASNAIGSMFGGNPSILREDLTTLLRNLSTVDKIAKVSEVFSSGDFESKTRGTVDANLKPVDAFAIAMGMSPAVVSNYFDYTEIQYKRTKQIREDEKRLGKKAAYAIRLMVDGDEKDMVQGTELYNEIMGEIDHLNYSPLVRMQMKRKMARPEFVPKILANGLRLGTAYNAERLTNEMKGDY